MEIQWMVPTYYNDLFQKSVDAEEIEEFGKPHLPIRVSDAAGLRIVLGRADGDDLDRPDIQIERQPNAWVLFLHPVAGCDACGYVYFLDDGRVFLRKERAFRSTFEILQDDERLPSVDGYP